jgi:hypothetical protein
MPDHLSVTLRVIGEFPGDGSQRPAETSSEATALQPEVANTDGRHELAVATSSEVVQLHVRVIALENLVIALLSEATERQLDLARGLASYIAPRPEANQHPLTAQAAEQILHFVDRSLHFRPM